MKKLLLPIVCALLAQLAPRAEIRSAAAAQKSTAPAASSRIGAEAPGTAAAAWALRPDLKIDAFWIAKDRAADPNLQQPVPLTGSPMVGQKIWFVCDGTNVGADAKGQWLVGFYVDGEMVWNNTWIDLAAGDSKRGKGPYTCVKEGAHTAECVLDPQGALSDRDQSNNRKTISFTVKPKYAVKKLQDYELKRVPPTPKPGLPVPTK